jgi:hypothetical protein
MAPACARPVSPVMMLQGLYSHPSLEDPVIRLVTLYFEYFINWCEMKRMKEMNSFKYPNNDFIAFMNAHILISSPQIGQSVLTKSTITVQLDGWSELRLQY